MNSQSSACNLDLISLLKKRKETGKMKKERERKTGNRKMQGLYTGDQVRNYFRHASSVGGFKLSSKSFRGWQGLNCSCIEKYTLFSAKASGFLEFRLKRPRPVGFSQQKAPITSTKSINNSAQLCAELRPSHNVLV